MGTISPTFNLDDVLADADSHVANEMASTPEVVDVGHDLDLTKIPIQARKWHKVSDAVAVVVDLKGSTQLGLNKWAASTASIYEAAIRPVVDIMSATAPMTSTSRATASSASSGATSAPSAPSRPASRSRRSPPPSSCPA